jgi:hypothetical protein
MEGRPVSRSRSVGHERLHCAGAQATDTSEDHAMPPVTDFKTAIHVLAKLDAGSVTFLCLTTIRTIASIWMTVINSKKMWKVVVEVYFNPLMNIFS